MKALTVKQPWAHLICSGIKNIENRTWKCPEKYIGDDISRCDNYKCKRRNRCARHQQSIADKDNTDEVILFSVTTFNNSNCKDFISIK